MDDTANLLREHDVDELWGVVIEAPDRDELKPMGEVTVPDPENPDRERGLFLGADPEAKRTTDRTFELQGSGPLRKMVTPDHNGAIAYFLSMLEQHDLSEDHVQDQMADLVDMEAYEEWRASLTPRDRRLRLLDQAEERIDHGAVNIEAYFDEGATFRETGLSDGAHRAALNLAGRVDANPRRCYENASQTVLAYLEEGSRDVQYVEGLALPKHPGRISMHAWLELDGKVVELTWPWHSPDPPAETVYFGVPVDADTLRERLANRPGTSNPVVVSEDVLDEMVARQSPD